MEEQQQQPLLAVSTVNNPEDGNQEGLDLDIDDEEEENRNRDNAEVIPKWWEQITLRGIVVSAFLGTIFCVITHKLNFTVGIIPSLNVAASLRGFFSVKGWTMLMSKLSFSASVFTRQENIMSLLSSVIVITYQIQSHLHISTNPISVYPYYITMRCSLCFDSNVYSPFMLFMYIFNVLFEYVNSMYERIIACVRACICLHHHV